MFKLQKEKLKCNNCNKEYITKGENLLSKKEIKQILEIINNEDEISVFQNPNNGGITLMHDTKNSGYLSVDIFDSTGKTVLTKIWQLSKGMNQIELNLLNNEKGTYNILITGQGGQIKKKFSIH